MRWSILYLVLVVVLLFAFSPLAFTEVILTDEEWTTLLTERESFKIALTTQETNFQETLEQLEIEHQNDLTKLENKYDQKIALLKIESEVRTASLTELKKETTLNYWKGFLSGLGVGGATGLYAGIKLSF